jgi:hypothetical protein
MDIGIVYSKKDPRQNQAREFVYRFVRERGVNATISEVVRNVESPTLIIDGQALADKRSKPREEDPPMFPGLKDIAAALERHTWCL